MTYELQPLIDKAMNEGWASGTMSLRWVQRHAQALRLKEVPFRRGDPPVTRLRPTRPEEAKPRSMSAVVGTGAQPLHTDGAHLEHPPDILVLHSPVPNPTPTLLWRGPGRGRFFWDWPEECTHGVFLVAGGKGSFFAAIRPDRGPVRYDPCCMSPCDDRARKAADLMASATAQATQHLWTLENEVLVIDNTRVLHARGDASTDTERLLDRVAYRLPEGD